MTGLAVDVGGRGLSERVRLLDRDVELAPRDEADGFGESIRHAPGHAGEPDTQLRRTEIGDGDDLLWVPGQLDEFADHARAGQVESCVLGRPLTDSQIGNRLHRIGVRPNQDRSTTLVTLAAEIPAAILARMLGMHIKVAVQWQQASAGDGAVYAADVSRRIPENR